MPYLIFDIHLSCSWSATIKVSIPFSWFRWVECSPTARETRVQSQIESYQILKKWYSMPPCLILSFIWYRSRIKGSNPEKGVVSFPTPQCSSYWKGNFRSPLTMVTNFTYFILLYRGWGGPHGLAANKWDCCIVSKVKLATLVKGNLKAPFSIATTLRCWEGWYSIPWIAPLYPWSEFFYAEC